MLEAQEKAHWWRTAAHASFLHSILVGEKAKSPKDLYDSWVPDKTKPKESRLERFRRAMRGHEARLEREKEKRVL